MNDDEFYGTDVMSFNADQIKAMTVRQYAELRDRLLSAAKFAGREETVTIPANKFRTSQLTCMWCAAGPYPTIEALEAHEEECR